MSLFVALGAFVVIVAGACSTSSVPDGGCDQNVACGSGQVCVSTGECKLSCSTLVDAGTTCPDGGACTGQGPYCAPGAACPALAVFACP